MANITTPSQLVVSIYGPHAGEDENAILRRKMADIQKVGFTLWLYSKGNKFARPLDVQKMAYEYGDGRLLLIHPSSPGGAGDTTKVPRAMREMSADGRLFEPIDPRLSPVTGSHDGFAFVISRIELPCDQTINLAQFANPEHQHVGFKIGNSTQIIRRYSTPPAGVPMKKPLRRVWAICTLAYPYCVFVR